MTTADSLSRGRESFERQAWGNAYALLAAADRESPLDSDDLDRFGTAAYLTGRDEDAVRAWERAFQGFVARDSPDRAIRSAFWLGFVLIAKGDMGQAGGWLARIGRLLGDDDRECAERGYALLPGALQTMFGGDPANAIPMFEDISRIAEAFGEVDLLALARCGLGRSLNMVGRNAEGISLLDEVMVAVTAGEVSPIPAGVIYCAVIEACQDAFDIRRAHEWTEALSRWCDAQPDLVPYRGQCLVHRAQIMQMHGNWLEAIDEVRSACERLADPPGQPAIGMAFYQRAELHRLCGEFAEAEAVYRQANDWGRIPQPGMSLLRLAQGHADKAAQAIRRVLDESEDAAARSKVLPAYVEIVLAVDDVPAARTAADELAAIARATSAPFHHAVARLAEGSVLIAEGDARAALTILRRAATVWQELEAPYEVARTRVAIGTACQKLGDDDASEMELQAARHTFEQLGAAPDLARVDEQLRRPPATSPGGLTPREAEVLRLVATGKSNRAIAGELVLSEKTVARHISNIFTKLGVASRSAATAYAYEHDLL